MLKAIKAAIDKGITCSLLQAKYNTGWADQLYDQVSGAVVKPSKAEHT
jgi:hypothetical protein